MDLLLRILSCTYETLFRRYGFIAVGQGYRKTLAIVRTTTEQIHSRKGLSLPLHFLNQTENGYRHIANLAHSSLFSPPPSSTSPKTNIVKVGSVGNES